VCRIGPSLTSVAVVAAAVAGVLGTAGVRSSEFAFAWPKPIELREKRILNIVKIIRIYDNLSKLGKYSHTPVPVVVGRAR
jgi:hypothetical protein